MSNIKASVIADSINKFGNRITTVMVTFPRIILAETNTHRALSRNSASSRAIPFRKMVETMFGEMNMRFTPIAWQKDHPGMQGTEYFTEPEKVKRLELIWDKAATNALESALELSSEGVTKQLCNRLLEPFMWHTVLITATEWENMFALRCPKYQIPNMGEGEEFYEVKFRSRKDLIKAMETSTQNNYGGSIEAAMELTEEEWLETNEGQAEIHMMALAEAIWDARNESKPTELKEGEWHIPFGDTLDPEEVAGFLCDHSYLGPGSVDSYRIKIATARCARVSYTLPGSDSKVPDYEADIKLHDRLASSGHWSPFEHCAKVMSEEEYYSHIQTNKLRTQNDAITDWEAAEAKYGEKAYSSRYSGEFDTPARLIHEHILPFEDPSFGWSGNFRGFIQYRKTFDNENIV